MAILQKPKPLTNEEKLAARRAEIDHNKAMQQQEADRRAEARAEHDAFVARAEATRREQAKARELGLEWVPDEPIPSLRDVWRERRAAKLAAEAAAEQARRDALTPRQLWFSTLPWQEQQRIQKWELVNRGQKYPVPGLE